MQIAKVLTANKILTSKAYYVKHDGKSMPENLYRWDYKSIVEILERPKYTSCTFNFKTYSKFHKLKNVCKIRRISQADTADKRLKLSGTLSGNWNRTGMNRPPHGKEKAERHSLSTMPSRGYKMTSL